MERAIQYIHNNRDRFVEEWKELLRIPSVSAKSERAGDCRKAAEFVRGRFEQLGMEAGLRETPGHPIVLAKSGNDPNKPTILVYGHYDVQPEEPVELWKHPPFEPTVENENLYARGATDDKGQMYTHIKAAEALLKTRGELPVNAVYLIEGEEEIASRNLESFIEANLGELRCDAAVISDTSQYAAGVPALCYGLRGICAAEIRVECAKSDLHSGQFGGAVMNPIQALCAILARCKDENGRVAVEGFYDNVSDLEDWEREAFASLPWDDNAFLQELGAPALHGEEGFTTLERKWARPTFELNGIFGGYSGEGSKTVLPSWAGAKITMRLVPRQTAEEIGGKFKDYIESIAPPSVRVSVTLQGGGNPVLIPRDSPFADKALKALSFGFGQKPVMIREGGSIPVVSTLKEKLGVHTMLLGYGRPDDNCHAPNEKMNVDDFIRGVQTSAWFLHLCGGDES